MRIDCFDIIIKYYLNNLKDSVDKIIYVGFNDDIKFLLKYDIPNLFIITFDNLNDDLKNIINTKNIELITIPYSYGIEELFNFALDFKQEVDNSKLINIYKDKDTVSAIFKNLAKDIYKKYPYDKIQVKADSNILIGIAKYYKMMDSYVIGIKNNDLELDLDYFDEINTSIDDSVIYFDY